MKKKDSFRLPKPATKKELAAATRRAANMSRRLKKRKAQL
jgi:hypothetical protein